MYIGLLPLIYGTLYLRPRTAFRMSFIWAFGLTTATLFWINWNTIVGGTTAMLAVALLFTPMGIFIGWITRRWGISGLWCLPFVWTGWEYLRTLTELGFPWLSLAYTQTYYLPFIQFSEWTSMFGVSFWVVLINVSLFSGRILFIKILLLIALFILPYQYGTGVFDRIEFPAATTVAIIQPNIDSYSKGKSAVIRQAFDTMERLSRESMIHQPRLLIWPETAANVWLRINRTYRNRLQNLSTELNVPLLTGTLDTRQDGRNEQHYNSIFLFRPDGVEIQDYAKNILVPFGERAPFEDIFPFLTHLDKSQANFSKGPSQPMLFLPPDGTSSGLNHHIAGVICFESIFPDYIRNFAERGMDYLVVITNDGWFGSTPGPFQHARMSIFRAIENRTSVARCANTGVSMLIDPYGRVISRLGLNEEGIVTGEIPAPAQQTFYSKHGNIFSMIMVGISLLICVTGLIVPK